MKRRMIKLINNERAKATISSQKGLICPSGSTDVCYSIDNAICSSYAYDACAKDYAGCSAGAKDTCTTDYAGCVGSGVTDNCGIDYDSCHTAGTTDTN